MNAPGMIEVSLMAVEPDGRRHEVARLVYVLEDESRVAELESENGKLRELVAEMWRFGFSENSGANSVAEWNEQASAIRDRMRELGIGVSE